MFNVIDYVDYPYLSLDTVFLIIDGVCRGYISPQGIIIPIDSFHINQNDSIIIAVTVTALIIVVAVIAVVVVAVEVEVV